MKYEILKSFAKRDGSFSQGQIVEESQIGEVGDLVAAKFIKPIDNRTATIKPQSEASEVVEPTEKKIKAKKKG